MAEEDTVVVVPSALSEAAVTRLIRDYYARDASNEFCRACALASGGNPLFAHELVRAAIEDGVPPDTRDVAKLERVVPAPLVVMIARSLARLPVEATAAARALAVLGGSAELRHVLALADLSLSEADSVEALTSTGLVDRGPPLQISHPLLRSAIYEDIAAIDRTRLHRRAALILDEEGEEPERVASHLLTTEPLADPWVCDRLRRAAHSAAARGAPASLGCSSSGLYPSLPSLRSAATCHSILAAPRCASVTPKQSPT